MFKKLLASSIVVGTVALGAPIAHAEHEQFDCGFNTIAQETATGGQDTFTGAAYGYVVGAPGEAVTVRCYVAVNGTEVGSTPTGSGTTAAGTAGQVTYTATDQDDVDLCIEYSTASEGTVNTCFETTTTTFPPQAVTDLLISLAEQVDAVLAQVFDTLSDLEVQFVDPVLCPIFVTLGGVIPDVPGVLEINGQGDVFLLGDPFWDCPPYDLFS